MQHNSQKTSKALWPFIPREPLLQVNRTDGAYLYLNDGSQLLDAAGGAVVVNVGHGRQEVSDAMARAAQTNSFVPYVWLTPERAALIKELQTHWLPSHLTRCLFTSSGTEANEVAVRMAIQYHVASGEPSKHQILTRSISYHGCTRAGIGWSGHPARKKGLDAYIDKNPTIETPYPLRCPLGKFHPNTTDYYIDNLKQTIAEIGADNIAALLAEPISGASGGAIVPPADYWPRVQEILKAHNILLIIDEVMTGFGRTGETTACKLLGIKPDLLTGGKGLAGGYAAINGVFGTDKISNTLKAGGFEPTYGTHSSSAGACAAATAVLKIQRRESLVERAKQIGMQLKQRLIDALGDHPHIAEIRGEGLLLGIEIVKDKPTLTPFDLEDRITEKIFNGGVKHGVFFYPAGTGQVRDIILLGPPFIITEQDIDLLIQALEKTLEEAVGQVRKIETAQ